MTNEEFIESITLDGEEWRDIPGFEGLYMASSEGRIISLGRNRRLKNGVVYRAEPILRKQTIRTSNGIPYYRVGLVDEYGKEYNKTTHRLVALAFHENPNKYSDVDHINRNSLDNRACNLRWCTRKMNMANEETRKIVALCHKGETRPGEWRAVVRIGDDGIKIYKRMSDAVSDGFSQPSISHVCRGDKKTHCGYQWVYLDEYEGTISSSISPV